MRLVLVSLRNDQSPLTKYPLRPIVETNRISKQIHEKHT